ncbi:MAG TPA: ABC transporter permease [Methylomusa anaerophila]|uniref:Putative aliphatic sulfonates transport permease protein SsuC n=1 Tax=Methylomusa anaerophila TaxID=1930071 RepID=A0A348AEV8_9FIRM|nr:ABC transporter permease [Methylomusa anaerophila]BBB89606.1 putative aliphatic sulfonates transport permease protein SsuC [Methylomusa anaerophila]HML89621.1 ABC transporter permease [Methylomusa anaerophila]
MVHNWIKRILQVSYRLLAVAVFLLIWEVAPRIGLADPTFLPPFSKVFTAFIDLISTGELFKHLYVSLRRSILGFSLGLAVSVPLGLLIGWFKGFEYLIDPLLQTFRQTSTLALFPVFILLFGIGELSKVAIIFWGVQWAILLNTIAGVKNVDPLLIKSAKSMGTSPFILFVKVIIPASVPSIFTGIRLSATTSILILIAAEMIGASAGLGFLLYDAEVKYQIPRMYASIITMSMLGLIVNYTLVAIEKRVTRWKEETAVV